MKMGNKMIKLKYFDSELTSTIMHQRIKFEIAHECENDIQAKANTWMFWSIHNKDWKSSRESGQQQ